MTRNDDATKWMAFVLCYIWHSANSIIIIIYIIISDFVFPFWAPQIGFEFLNCAKCVCTMLHTVDKCKYMRNGILIVEEAAASELTNTSVGCRKYHRLVIGKMLGVISYSEQRCHRNQQMRMGNSIELWAYRRHSHQSSIDITICHQSFTFGINGIGAARK